MTKQCGTTISDTPIGDFLRASIPINLSRHTESTTSLKAATYMGYRYFYEQPWKDADGSFIVYWDFQSSARMNLLPESTPHTCEGPWIVHDLFEDPAKFYCRDCKIVICSNCFRNHNHC